MLQDRRMKDGEAVNSRRVFYTPAALVVLKTQGMPEITSRGEAVPLRIKSAASFFSSMW